MFVKIYLGIDEKINDSIKADGYKQKGVLGMNFSPNNVPLYDFDRGWFFC